MSDTTRAVISLHEAARVLFNEGREVGDKHLQSIAARVLAFTATWLGVRGVDEAIIARSLPATAPHTPSPGSRRWNRLRLLRETSRE